MDVTNGYGADVNLEGTGHPSALIQGLDLLRTLGTFVEYGVFGSDFTVDWSIISDDKELKRPRGAPRPNCWSDPNDRVRSAGTDKIFIHNYRWQSSRNV
jgi:threonine dehydrogenase-like Zn-dependent dehydrogenase